jgi:hypothetical protein
VVYRFGDVSSAWLQTGLASLGYGLEGALLLGASASMVWGAVALGLGRRYGRARASQSELECAALTLPANPGTA